MANSPEHVGIRSQSFASIPVDYGENYGRSFQSEVDRLTQEYNFPDRYVGNVFVDLLEAAIQERINPSVLDIGCGKGIFNSQKHQARLRPHIDRFIGVEPDDTVSVSADTFDSVHAALMENAPIPKASVDVAYAVMVAEHVADPQRFLESIERCLRPGGILLICTPNAKTYFGRACVAAQYLGIEDRLLRMVRGSECVDGYHYPTVYRMNTSADLETLGRTVGLDVKVGYTESKSANREYFPALFRPIWSALKLKRRVWRNPQSLDHVIAVFEKPR